MGFSISFSSSVRSISWFIVNSEAQSILLTACLSVLLGLVRLSYIHIHDPRAWSDEGEGRWMFSVASSHHSFLCSAALML